MDTADAKIIRDIVKKIDDEVENPRANKGSLEVIQLILKRFENMHESANYPDTLNGRRRRRAAKMRISILRGALLAMREAA